MEIIRENKKDNNSLSDGILKSLKVRTDGVEILNLRILPGNALKPHDMPSKVIFFVVEGNGEFTYDNVMDSFSAGDMVHVDPGKLRFWANNSDSVLRLLVIKSLTEK